ncbi:MAG: hypothetical protein GVY16_05835 [Planctomycetes bacterium]|nr:hypothetical protein [Phycisphaerae bacterium]NBB95242.1 hypothetical protein [Planctomycetota bacterium]
MVVKSQAQPQDDAAATTGPDGQLAGQDNGVMTVEELREAAKEPRSPESIDPKKGAMPPTPRPPTESAGPSGPTVKVLRAHKVTALGDDASDIAGTFRNDNDFLLSEVQIRVVLKNPAGAIMPLQSRAYKWIPAGMHGRFSVSADNKLIPADATVSDATGYAVRAPDEYVGWTLGRFTRRITDDGRIRLTGHSRNPHDCAVHDVKVLCDFFTVDGTYAGTATGQLRRGATTIGTGAEVSYEILFEPPLSPEVIGAALARIVAQKP